jgi:hypothetical protein
MRSEQEIKNFLSCLKQQRRCVECIDAAIETVEEQYDEDDVWDKEEKETEFGCEGEWNHEQICYALDAIRWMDGESDGSEFDYFDNVIYDIKEVAEKIGIPVSEWGGNCYGIACACVEKGVVKGKARYGQFHGYIARTGRFAGRQVNQHGWVEMENGKIFDPTRWAFEDTTPYIYVGDSLDDYDMGANKLKKMMNIRSSTAPEYNEKSLQVKLASDKKTLKDIKELLNDKRKGNTFSINQLHWLSGINPLESDFDFAKRIFNALKDSGQGGLIPIDNYEYVFNG